MSHSRMMMVNYHVMMFVKELFYVRHCGNLRKCQPDLQRSFKLHVDAVNCRSRCVERSGCWVEICKLKIYGEINPKPRLLSCFVYIFGIRPKSFTSNFLLNLAIDLCK